ncbi:MAG: hypothetical protein PWP24_1887 [Clostridiales bacterium]|nr:hypothetical protein [Clostridiales bacterium]
MKKRFLLFISIIWLLTGCSSSPEVISEESYKEDKQENLSEQIQNINITNGKELLFGEDKYCNIIFFDSEQLIFVKEGDVNKELDVVNSIFYHYDFTSGKTAFLTEVNNVSSSTQDIAILDNRIYDPLCISTEEGLIEYILEISLDDFSSRLVRSSETNSKVTRLEATENAIYRYYQKDLSTDKTDFFIDNIGTLDTTENIINKRYQNSSGEILVSTCLYEDKIYTYNVICGENEQYLIKEYSLEGDLLKNYPIDLTDFLKLKEVDDTDAVYRIFREGDYIILNTLNNRIKIYKISKDQLFDVETLPEFEKLLGARVIENYGNKSSYVYFQDGTGNNMLYVFDTKSGEISKINLIEKESLSCYILRDEDGNIIVIAEYADNRYRYYLIGVSDIIEVLKK